MVARNLVEGKSAWRVGGHAGGGCWSSEFDISYQSSSRGELWHLFSLSLFILFIFVHCCGVAWALCLLYIYIYKR